MCSAEGAQQGIYEALHHFTEDLVALITAVVHAIPGFHALRCTITTSGRHNRGHTDGHRQRIQLQENVPRGRREAM